jgi:phosphoglycolate phosphatase-like HAD superfamily hydrolase
MPCVNLNHGAGFKKRKKAFLAMDRKIIYENIMMPKIALAIWDFDNTLTDTLSAWSHAMKKVIDQYEQCFGTDPEILRAAILQAHSQHRFCDFGGLSYHLDQNNIPDKTQKTLQDIYTIDILRRNIRTAYFYDQREQTQFYPHIWETLKRIADSKTTQVIYSDSEAPPLIRRLYFCFKNDGIRPIEGLKVFDRFYVKPSVDDDKYLLWDIDPDFLKAVKAKITLITDKKSKPNDLRLKAICADYKTPSDQALMIGDSVKDIGSALPLSMPTAWYKPGTTLSDEASAFIKGYASPDYIYGLEAMTKAVRKLDGHEKVIVLSSRIDEIFSHVRFVPTQSSYHHSLLSLTQHTPLEQIPSHLVPIQTLQQLAQFGPPTHFVIRPQESASADPYGMADLKTLHQKAPAPQV